MADAPERIRVAQDTDGFWTCREAVSGSQEYVRVDLYAALEAQLAARTGAVKVKALDWSDHPAGGEQALGAGLGLYRVHSNGDAWYLVPDYMGMGGKAAAQADYERRILSALSPAPEAQQEPHEVLHVYDGDGGVIIRENGNISTFGTQTPAVHAAFEAASDAEAQQEPPRPAEQAVTEAMIMVASDQISEGLGAYLRKFADSDAAKQARYWLHKMPDTEWNGMARLLAEEALGAALKAAMEAKE